MRIQIGTIAAAWTLAAACAATSASAQTPPAATPTGSVVVASPTYTSIPMEIMVNRSAADVWKKIGGYCDISEWLQIPAGCKITSGKDGEFGAVRTVGAEVLVGRTELSYTYTQTPKEGQPYNMYHGTLEARPVTATTSKIVYTLFFDNSMLARRCGAHGGQGETAHAVHAGAAEHEDAGGRRQTAAARAASRRPGRTAVMRRTMPSSWSSRGSWTGWRRQAARSGVGAAGPVVENLEDVGSRRPAD